MTTLAEAAANYKSLTGGVSTQGIRMANQAMNIPKLMTGTPLGSAIVGAGDMIRKHLIGGKPVTGESAIDTSIRAAHPLLAISDAVARKTTGKSLREGFVEGTTMTGDVRVPPMAF